MCRVLCMCVESVCGVCAEGVGDVRFVFWCLWCVCGVWCLCVARLGTRKKLPCVGSKSLRVQVQNASVCTGKTLRDVLNLHTERREGFFFSLFLSPSISLVFSRPFSFSLFFLPSLFLHSLPLCSFSFSSLSLFSSLSVAVTKTTRPVGSLSIHTALTCESVEVLVLRSIPCLANMFTLCKKQLSGITVQASCHLE